MVVKELEDCNQCPLLGEMRIGGMTSSPSGEPIEPPCAAMDWNPDDDLDDIYNNMIDSQRRYENYLDKQWEKEEANRKAREEKVKKSREAKSITYSETKQITRLRKQIRNNNKLLNFARSYVSAVNLTNEMFGYEERIVEKPKNPLEIENEELQLKINEIDKVRKEKLKQLRERRKLNK